MDSGVIKHRKNVRRYNPREWAEKEEENKVYHECKIGKFKK